jgi:aspartyl protease family protein
MKSQQSDAGKTVGQLMIYLAWILFLGFLTMAFNKYLEQQNNPNQTVQSHYATDNIVEVVLTQNRQGHYLANGTINQFPVTFLLDTGATHISIPLPVAERLGLKKGYALPTVTANGTIKVFSTRLESVSIGKIQLNNIRAGINPHMQGNEILLGMNFLRHLELIQRNGQLTLRQDII